jgi:hypothetical protein
MMPWSGGANVLAYTNKVIALSPIAYFPQAEASGTVCTDESGNARNGVYKASGEPLLGQTGVGDGRTAPLYDGTNDFANIFTAGLQGAFSGAEGTLALWMKVSAVGVWTDGATRLLARLAADANNQVRILRTVTNNQIRVQLTAGGTASLVGIAVGPTTGWVHLAVTWSDAADQLIAYLNGAQSGATQTGLGTFAGSLATTTVVLGAADTASTTPWSGYLAHAAVWATPLSAAQIATLAVVP